MAQARDSKGRFVRVTDSMTTFAGALGGWKDSLFAGVTPSSVFDTSWLMRDAIESIPEDCFKKGYQWQAETSDINAIEKLERQFDIKRKKRQAMEWARREGECYVYFDLGDDPARELRLDSVRINQLRFVNVIRRNVVSYGEIDYDPMSQYYGQPLYYEINAQRFHPSRMVRVVVNPIPETGRGLGITPYLIKPLSQLNLALDNVAELTSEARIDVMSVCGLSDAVSDPTTEAQLVKRYALVSQLKRTNKMIVLDKEGEQYQQKQSSFATLPDIIESFRREWCAATGRPYALVYGRQGGLGTNGDMDLKNYYDNIASLQRNEVQPAFERLDDVVIRSAIGSRPEDIYLDWLSLWEMSDNEKATVAKTLSDAVVALVNSGVMPAEVLTQPVISALSENGSLPGIEQSYADWLAGGGVLSEADNEGDVAREQGGEEDAASLKDAAPSPLYVSRKVLNGADIIKWARAQGFMETLSADDLHVTITYSRDPVDWMKMGSAWQSKLEIAAGGPRQMDEFGRAKVLRFSSSDLTWRNTEMRENGASWDYEEYSPHITISYGDMPESVTPYQGEIILGPEIFEVINEDWSGSSDA